MRDGGDLLVVFDRGDRNLRLPRRTQSHKQSLKNTSVSVQ